MSEPGRPAPQPPEEEPPRGWLRLLVDPLFGRYFFGRTVSSAGVWIHNLVAALLAFQLTGSAFVVGLISAAQFSPQVLLGPLSGAQADRGDRKRQAILGRLIVAGASGLLALWLVATDVTPQTDVVVLVATAFVVGVGFVTGGPAMHAMVPSLVRRNELASAVTLGMAPVTIARAGGPAVGVALALAFGPSTAFLLAALCNVGFAAMLVRLDAPVLPREEGIDRSIRAGFTFVRRDRVTAMLLVGVATAGLGADPAITLAPSLSAQLGHGTSYVGAFASAFGVGAGAAFLVIPLIHRRVGLVGGGTLGLAAMAVGVGALAVIQSPSVALLAFGTAGLGLTVGSTSLSSRLQERLPEDYRGRVMALWSIAYLGSRPLAATMNGAVADLVSVQAAFVVVALLLAVSAWLCSTIRSEP